MKERYDVVVVGAGPSGLLAAKAVAENGFDVAVVERKEKIEVVGRTCGQTLLPPNDYFFGDLFHYNARDKKFCFPKSGLSFSYSGPIKNLYDWYMYSPGMKQMHFGYPEGYTPPVPGMQKAPIAFTYDKEVMTADLLKEARTAGAEIFENCEFTDIVFAGPETIVVAGGKQFRCTYVIAADGTNSRVAQKLGFNNDRRHISNLFVKSYFVSGFKAPVAGDPIVTGVIMYQGKPVYLFAVPRPVGGDWNLLFLTLEQDVDINAAAQYVMKESSFAPYCKAVKIQRELAAMEVIQSPIVKPVKNSVVIVGDAGSCQELECLGAMITGWKGGLAVAAALKEFQLGIPPRAIADYCDWWLNTYIKQYDYQDYLQVFGIAYMFPKPEIIDYIFSILNQTFPPTFNPYTSVKNLGVAMQMAFPKIMAERPDILQALVPNMLAFPSDVLAKTLKKE